ncbi:MAG: hypothetical protein OSA97_06375 [Nevskia sp.]|nr:hypothetical protein [Nevskia sp.]
MLKDFDATKKQLAELAEVINKFKSDAVQLRLIDLLFSGATPGEPAAPREASEKLPRRKKGKRAAKAESGSGGGGAKSPRKASSGSGAVATLQKIVDDDFFKQPRTISDICGHSSQTLARPMKSNDISGKLARLVREKVLSRTKNAEGQYEYKNA